MNVVVNVVVVYKNLIEETESSDCHYYMIKVAPRSAHLSFVDMNSALCSFFDSILGNGNDGTKPSNSRTNIVFFLWGGEVNGGRLNFD